MKHTLLALAVIVAAALSCGIAVAQGNQSDFPNYGTGSSAIVSTPGTQGGAAGAYWNPAAWGAMQEFEFSFLWNDRNVNQHRMDNWGLFLGGDGIGFAMRRNNFLVSDSLTGRLDDYEIGLGGGDREDYWGISWGWSRGDTRYLKRDDRLTAGYLTRPFPFLSVGGAGTIGIHHGDYRGIADMGVRPLSNHRITLFGDAAAGRWDNPTSMQWGAGLELIPLDGIRVAGKVTKPCADTQDKIYSISLGLSISGSPGKSGNGFHVVPHYDKDSERLSTSYLIRMGAQAPSFNTRRLIRRGTDVVSVPMKGALAYHKAKYFDEGKIPFYETLKLIDNAKADPAIGGLAINLSGMEARREMVWELREKLKEFKAEGKKVYIYVDRAGMTEYHLASVADYVWMDPEGTFVLPGYVMGRTFWKNFLTKVGLQSEEWRYFTYKSAFEQLSRTNMSEADREQRLVLIQDLYADWEKEVTERPGVTAEALATLRDSMMILTTEDVLAAHLVDTVGTWDDLKDFVEAQTGKKPTVVKKSAVRPEVFADQTWGVLPKVALVYAIGDCDLDTGIRGRYTSRLLRKLAHDKQVKAVVLRADSPGGDALPSDLVARQMIKVSDQKPMIVSQGSVAASGGYWISMNGDRIFTAPMTITGSIGVIGGWVWNDKFSEKTGFTSDHVQVGAHCDLLFGVTVPFIGVTIPDRNLDDVEHRRVEFMLRNVYQKFVEKVAEGRDLDSAYVDSVGQGRAWSGRRAIELKLCDEIGGLSNALDYAKAQAKIKKGRKYEVVEYPKPGLFNPQMFAPSGPMSVVHRALFGETASPEPVVADYELRVLKRMAEKPGEPLLMIPPEDLPLEDCKADK